MHALQIKCVDVSDACPLFRNEPEDDFHAIVSCPFFRPVWSLTSLGSFSTPTRSIMEWWNTVVVVRETKDIDVVALVMWSICHNRNNVVWDNKLSMATRIYRLALDHLSQWHDSQIHFAPLLQPTHQINASAAIQGRIHGNKDPNTKEALSIREALKWIKNLQLSPIIVESDALVVIEALHRTVPDHSSLFLIIEDCKLLAQDVSSCSFVYVRRLVNQAAHTFARGTASMSNLIFLLL
ncbi:uncharacterized protein [Henckelia pumila]|uniref:uncharacterized protein n=1 Tax=Henckelia pumila TaxID=405737 RepID=UPI003C6E1168